MFILNGKGHFESREMGKIPLEAGGVVLLFPGIWHRYRPDIKTGWKEKWMHFNGEFAHMLLDQQILSPRQSVLGPADFDSAEKALDQVLGSVKRNPSSNSLLLSLQGMGVLAAVLENSPTRSLVAKSNIKPADPFVASAIDYIWTRSHHILSVPDVAKALGTTRRTLERRMAAALHRSVLDEIIECRFSRAERLLRETNLPIKTVVTLAGFGSIENMRHIFQIKTQRSPMEYRNRQR